MDLKQCGLHIKGPQFVIFTFLKDVFHPLKIILIFRKQYQKVSEYDQEIPQSHTADQPMVP